jgi:hypothetical protein
MINYSWCKSCSLNRMIKHAIDNDKFVDSISLLYLTKGCLILSLGCNRGIRWGPERYLALPWYALGSATLAQDIL